jgi:hypothetical protein
MSESISLRDQRSRRSALQAIGSTGLATIGLSSIAAGGRSAQEQYDCTWTRDATYQPISVSTAYDNDLRFDLLSAVGYSGPCEVRTPGFQSDGDQVEYTIATSTWASAQFVGGEKDGELAPRLGTSNGFLGTTEIRYPYDIDDPKFRSDSQFVGARRASDGQGKSMEEIAHGTGAANPIESWAAGQFIARLGGKVPLLGIAVDLIFAAGAIEELVNIFTGKKAHTDQFTFPTATSLTPVMSMHRQFRWVMPRSETAEIEIQNMLGRTDPPADSYGGAPSNTYESFEHTITLDPPGGDEEQSDDGDGSGGFDWPFW